MTTAVERKHKKTSVYNFSSQFMFQDIHQRMNKNDVKIRDEFIFSVVHRSMNAKLT